MISVSRIMKSRGICPNKTFTPGVDLPAWFYYNLKSIDENFCFIYHPYDVLWDDIINEYSGSLEDPRFSIHKEAGEVVFGFILTNNVGNPKPDGKWHLWRWSDNAPGFAHIVKVDSKDPNYLMLLLSRIYLQAVYNNKGNKAWRDKLMQDADAKEEKALKDREDKFKDVQNENSWLLKAAKDNMERGNIKPTNPQHGQIISYPGQKNRSTIRRPVTDEEAKLIIPD